MKAGKNSMPDDLEVISMQIIVHAGNAKAEAYDALQCAKKKDFTQVENLLKKAEDENIAAHKIHLQLLGLQGGFKNINEQLLVTHAMDTMMTTMSEINLIKELIDLYKEKVR